ncbi:MAG: hypothetical protein IPH88_08050 [Bacteroidales bacterium]|nr:hypothetical protein [Bacteroidales bacterium]
MNFRILSLSMFLTSVLLFTGCKKEETDDSGAASLLPGKSQISCTVSGAATSSFNSNIQLSSVLKSDVLMNISGSSVTGMSSEIVMLILPANVTAGTYTSESNNSGDFAFSYSKGADGWAADVSPVFTVVVTKSTATEIEGTFSGVLNNDNLGNQVTIKDGKFAAKF